jgi:hypothetical protein
MKIEQMGDIMWNNEVAQEFVARFGVEDHAASETLAAEVAAAGARLSSAAPALAAEVRETSIGHVRGLFSPELCDALNDELKHRTEVVVERVETDEGRWQIDLIDNAYLPIAATVPADPFSVLCLDPEFFQAIGEISAFTEPVITTRRWVNRYGPGDSITPHDDTTGDFQIMICLEAPPTEFGGTLVFENGVSADLQRGDLLIMRHAGLVHWTTVLADNVPCQRATATCRYYVEGGRLPRSKVMAHTLAGPVTAGRSA